jgi:hypothetical protein
MQQYFDHPSEEALERFLFKHSPEVELEYVETHILACDSCVARLELLETQIAAAKVAFKEFQRQPQKAKSKLSWKSWFTIPKLSLAGAMAAAVLSIAAFLPAHVNLSAYAGAEITLVPEWRPLEMHLNASDLPEGRISARLVNSQGTELWKGSAVIRNEKVDVRLPRIIRDGSYFLRLYAPETGLDSELLREFAFQTR